MTSLERRQAAVDELRRIVCEDRQEQYGQPEDNFGLIARFWGNAKGIDFTPEEVAIFLTLVKVARVITGKPKADNWIDMAGYSICGAGMIDPEAPSPEERAKADITETLVDVVNSRTTQPSYPVMPADTWRRTHEQLRQAALDEEARLNTPA